MDGIKLPEAVNLQKKQIRKSVLGLRDSMPVEERDKASISLTGHLIDHPWFYQSDKLLCFVSFGSEFDTTMVIEEALRVGKQVFVPKVMKKNNSMEKKHSMEEMIFYCIQSFDNLQAGYKGIREPVKGCEKYSYDPKDSNTLMIMPGVAFDRMNRRIGYGKGFYDRFLADKEALRRHTIAVGFACQMLEVLPEEEQDIRPCQIIVV